MSEVLANSHLLARFKKISRLLLNQKTARPKTHKKLFWILPRVSAYFCGTYEDTLFSVAVC